MDDQVFEGEHEVNFTWFANIDLPDISSVEMLLAPARSVWDDHFNENSYTQNTVSYGLKPNNGVFSKSIHLKPNIYHFLFRINCTNHFAASCKHNITYLANGRTLNYVNVGDPLGIFLINKQDLNEEKSALRDPVASSNASSPLLNSQQSRKRTGLRRWFLCCSYQ